MDAAALVEALLRRWPVVVVLVLLGGLAGSAASLLQPPEYRATTTVFVTLQGGESVNELSQGATYAQSLVQSYAEVATLPVVLGPVAADLGVEGGAEEVADRVTVEAPAGTALLLVGATGSTGAEAVELADAVAGRIASATDDLAPSPAAGTGVVQVATVQPAAVPDAPDSPPLLTLAVVGALLGAGVGVGALLVVEVLAAPVRDRSAVRRLTDAPVLAEVPQERGRPVTVPATRRAPRGARADAARALRTNLRFLAATDRARVVVVAGATPGVGATTTAVDLAAAAADVGLRVLLVDADLRTPHVAAALALPAEAGLSDVLAGGHDLEDALHRWGSPAVDVLAAGAEPPSPSELLASPRAQRLLPALAERYDLVVLDAPAVLGPTDAAALAALADGAVLVVDSRRTSQRRAAAALERLDLAGAAVLGVVLGRTRPPRRRPWSRAGQDAWAPQA